MTDIVARLRRGSKHFEILVDQDAAIKIRRGESQDIAAALRSSDAFYNIKSGEKASKKDLIEAFTTADFNQVALQIIKKGEIEISQEHRDEERDKKKKQVVDWYVRNAIDAKTNRPFTAELINSALDQAKVNIDNKQIEQQITAISGALALIIPLKIETKKLIITIPAVYTGKVYGIINEYKEKEEWLGDGSLKVIVNIPLGLQSEFYDKLNSVTHGAALTEEIKDKV